MDQKLEFLLGGLTMFGIIALSYLSLIVLGG